MRNVIIAGFLALLTGATASAQSDNSQEDAVAAMETCRSISVVEVRQACMIAAANVLDRLSTTNGPSVSETVTAPPANSGTIQQTAADLEIKRNRLEAERIALEAEKEEIQRQRIELAKVDEVEKTERSGLSRFSPFSTERSPKIIPVTIVKITVNRRKLHRFFTSDGDVLTQSDVSQKLYAPSALPAQAKVTRSFSGARWLAFDERPKRGLKIILPED